MEDLKILSLNVNGLNVPTKRRAVFDHLRKSKADFCLIQETHSTPTTEKLWKAEWGGSAWFSHGSRSSRGVAILVSRNLKCKITNPLSDKEGRYMFGDFQVGEAIYTIASIYAPTQDKRAEQISFLEELDEQLRNTNATNIILGGDLNYCLSPTLPQLHHKCWYIQTTP